MRYFLDVNGAADPRAVNQTNWERLDALMQSILGDSDDAGFRIKDGNIQIWDDAAYAADPTKPWRVLLSVRGAPAESDPVEN